MTVSALSLGVLGACTTTGNTERGAAVAAATGAVVGAVIGNNTGIGDAKTGAAIGAVVGGAGGAYAGTQKDKAMGEKTQIRRAANGQQLYFDEATKRYFWVEAETGKTYYENGELRR